MPLVLSFLRRRDAVVLRNHAHYCGIYGYPHLCVDAGHIRGDIQSHVYRYNQMSMRLRSLREGDWLLMLDGDSVFFKPVEIDVLLKGRDSLVVDGPSVAEAPAEVLTNMLAFRNTAANRALLDAISIDLGRAIALESDGFHESACLRAGGVLAYNAQLAGLYVNVTWRVIGWYEAEVFVVNLGPLNVTRRCRDLVDVWLHDQHLQDFLARRVTAALIDGETVLQAAAGALYTEVDKEAVSSYNASARIAFITLYTPNIAVYAHVAEQNIKRYCDRHGYAFHVYRAVPQEIGPDVSGNWAKPWVLRRHLDQHEWVIWIDADMLFTRPDLTVDPLLANRDVLIAGDVGSWRVNSGLMGFRNTEANAALLTCMWDTLSEVSNRSDVYSSLGDQHYVNRLLQEIGLDGDDKVLDMASINTPVFMRDAESLLVHFMGLGEPYRSAYMADVDRSIAAQEV